jgi:ATP-dependent protease ClpP protease subunit
MPSWNRILSEIHTASIHDIIRRKYLKQLSDKTERNAIAYYSGWMEKEFLVRQGLTGFEVNDGDKNGFMATIHELDRSKGLDLVLHTPGGDVAATESLVGYLRLMFDGNIRVIIPHMAMSAGTMIALAANTIVMGKHSSIGPIDPQVGGVAAHAIIDEFEQAKREITANPLTAAVWQPIIAKYSPTLIGECAKAIDWATSIVKDWLATGMFADQDDPIDRACRVVEQLGSHNETLAHNRHISACKARELGIHVVSLEEDSDLQEAVLSVHHAYILTLTETPAYKIIENQNGVAFINAVQVLPGPAVQAPQRPASAVATEPVQP